MRADAIGLFWQDIPREYAGKNIIARPIAPIPETGWVKPGYFPDLSGAPCLAIDTETYDPELLENGPGWARGRGHMVGVSIGAPGGYKWYFPFRHEVGKEDNLDPDHVLSWLRDTLSNPRQAKIGANLLYDVGWLRQEGVRVKGDLVDVQFAEALLDESSEVNLEVLAQKYLREGKESSLLYQWCADSYGGSVSGRQRANIYRSPPSLVGPYAEADADLPLRVANLQHKPLMNEGLYNVFRMECDLIYLLVEMRFAGVSVDIPKAEKLQRDLQTMEQEAQRRLDNIAGIHVETTKSSSIAKAFSILGIPVPTKYDPKTREQKPSFGKELLAEIDHPMMKPLHDVKLCNKLRKTFVEAYILNAHVDGKVYGQFHPLRGDADGTRSGRFSSSTPNLQNLPSRDELAPLVRGIFIPDVGHKQWRKYDYSQIEYRFLAHFAQGVGSDEVRHIFNTNPKADYHEVTQKLVFDKTGHQLGRKPAKTINFGLCYGMGVDKLALSLGLDKKGGKELFAAYHAGAPFVQSTMDAISKQVMDYGYVKTILGRKSRFELWEPDGRTRRGERMPALPFQEAVAKYGSVKRAFAHKGLNRLLQGSAADLAKMAMWKCWKDGVFDVTGVPRLLVHDEFDFSDEGGKDEAFEEMQRIMQTAIPLSIPVMADGETGPDWGHVG